MKCSRFVLLGALLLGIRPVAQAGEPPTEPILRIEPGMHTALIPRIATDSAGRWLVTASQDKTARVWDAQSGQLLKVLRPPIGRRKEGMLYAVALSPDGSTVACAGITGSEWDKAGSIYLFDRATGRLVRRFGALPEAVLHLAFSPDGQFLAATLRGQLKGLRVWRTSDWTQVAEDTLYGSDGYGAAFDSDLRLAVTSLDGYVRLYDSDFKLKLRKQAPGGKQPYSVAWSPDGTKLVVGFIDTPNVDVLSARNLERILAPDTAGVGNGGLGRATFSADGRTLYAAGSASKPGQFPVIRSWTRVGEGDTRDTVAGRFMVLDLLARPQGGAFFCTADPAFGFVDRAGQLTHLQPPPIVDLRPGTNGFRVSTNGSSVAFSFKQPADASAVFSVPARQLSLASAAPDLKPARLAGTGLLVTGWADSLTPKLNGREISLEPFERSHSLAIAPDNQLCVLGTEWFVHAFEPSGKKRWEKPAPGVTWALNITEDGKVLVAAFHDGTIRWYRLADGRELLALFPHADRKRWIIWTPDGYYDCSVGGEDLIGWHINNGKDNAADFFPASRFRNTKYRPDVIARVLDTLDPREAFRLSNEESGRKPVETELQKHLPPVVTIISPASDTPHTSTNLTLRYSVRTPSGEPVTGVRVLVDGSRVQTSRGVRVEASGPVGAERVFTLPLPESDCEVSIIASNRFSSSVAATVNLKWAGKPAPSAATTARPKLFALVVGVNAYPESVGKLELAAKDARDFAAALKEQEGALYSEVSIKLLIDEKASRINVMDGLEWLEATVTNRIDHGVVYLAGHGKNDASGTYYFLPQGANPQTLKSTCVSFADIQNTLSVLSGKALCFLDTCHAAALMSRQIVGGRKPAANDVNRPLNELDDAGVVVFAAATVPQEVGEFRALGNGAFTKAVVEGLRGKADKYDDKRITVSSLGGYVENRVPKLTGDRQHPVIIRPGGRDFPIALLK